MIQQLVMYEEELQQINRICETLHRDANARAVLDTNELAKLPRILAEVDKAIRAAEQAAPGRVVAETLADARRFLAEAERQIQQEAYGSARMNAVRAKNRAILALRSSEAARD